MNIGKIVWKNMWFKKTLTVLTILSIAIAISLIIFIELMNEGLENGVAKGYGPYELVIGAEGSSSQLVLNTFYHVGAPVGNIDYQVFENIESGDLEDAAYPVTRGDNYKGFAIIGTPSGYLSTRYPEVSLQEGDIYRSLGDVVLGNYTAKQLGLKIGDNFSGNHGVAHGEEHTDLTYQVVGILPTLGSPDDKAIFTTLDAAWVVHGEEGHEEGEEERHESGVEQSEAADGHESNQITAIVVKPKGLMELQQLKSEVDELVGVQATYSSKALSDVLSVIDTGSKVVTLVAGVTIVIVGISMLLSLTARAAERRKDIGLLRLIGKPKTFIFNALLLEAGFMTLIGGLLGILFGHVGGFFLSDIIFQYAGIEMSPWSFFISEVYVLLGIILLGILSALMPAIQSYRVNPIELFHS